ncbi:hypothetical protein B0O99DRAFT_739460 [Bisporella sp. PMI_857]|nr:hypothetical protein B0O99DRAFT_739460 [Bisporella sp. PMI_857]
MDRLNATFIDYLSEKGITPLDLPTDGSPLTQEQTRQVTLWRQYQASKLNGWMVQDLINLGCWEKKDAKPSELGDIPLHPLFATENWVTLENLPAHSGTGTGSGNGSGGDRRVFDVLKPVLGLATMLIQDSGLWVWLDSLLHEPWKKVDPSMTQDGCPPGHPGYQAYMFEPTTSAKRPKEKPGSGYLLDLANNIVYQLESVVVNASLRARAGVYQAYTTGRYAVENQMGTWKGSIVHILTEHLELLMPPENKLTESQRLVQQFIAATTHAAGLMKRHHLGLVLNSSEPFFCDESVCELGASWENMCYGGKINSLLRHDGITFDWPSPGAVCFMPWPNWLIYGDGKWSMNSPPRYRTPNPYPPDSHYTACPIPTDFIEAIQQKSFWDRIVLRFGRDAFNFSKRGCFIHYKERPQPPHTRARALIAGADQASWSRWRVDGPTQLATFHPGQIPTGLLGEAHHELEAGIRSALTSQRAEFGARQAAREAGIGLERFRAAAAKPNEQLEQAMASSTWTALRRLATPGHGNREECALALRYYRELLMLLMRSTNRVVVAESLLLLSTMEQVGDIGARGRMRSRAVQELRRLDRGAIDPVVYDEATSIAGEVMRLAGLQGENGGVIERQSSA